MERSNIMEKTRLHYVPLMIQELADNAIKSDKQFLQDTYLLRLESIREYCDEAIHKILTKREKN